MKNTKKNNKHHRIAAGTVLLSGVTPAGSLVLRQGSPAEGSALPVPVAEQVERAFARGRGHAALHLGAALVGTELPASLGFWRDLGQDFVAAVCAASAQDDESGQRSPGTAPPPDTERLAALASAVPPMPGGEVVTPELLAEVWAEMGAALAEQVKSHADGIAGFLAAHHSVWHTVGRVCFHLAENRRDAGHPFAFLATLAERVTGGARGGRGNADTRADAGAGAARSGARAGATRAEVRVQHRPLGQALREASGARQRERMLRLLAPLQRAAANSSFMRELVDSGDIHHPLAWTPAEAYAFLQDVPLYERAGVVVRVPDWWSARSRARPVVSVSVGSRPPSALGMAALLDFDVSLVLGGETLSPSECEALLSATDGLVWIKGRWVEVDRERLAAVLEHWSDVQQQARREGIGFAEAMRLLAGARLDGDRLPEEAAEATADGAEGSTPAWSQVVAGRWLAERLEGLRESRLDAAVRASAGVRAELRAYQERGVAWLWTLRALGLGACLADDMGLGKTLQVLAVLSLARRQAEAVGGGNAGAREAVNADADRGSEQHNAHATGPNLLVVPASLIDNWQLEAERFTPQLRLLVAHTSHIDRRRLAALTPGEVDAHDVVITSYATLARLDWMREHRWHTVVLDEAQAIKNPAARQTRAVKALRADWRVALTGTPVENRLGDLWSIFDFLNPGLLGSARAFGRFCKTLERSGSGGYAPLRRLIRPYLLRRLKTDRAVIADLPEKTEVNAWCLLGRGQAALYQQSVDELRARLSEDAPDGMQRRGLVLAFLLRFKQICNHPSQWLGDGAWDPAASGKFARLRELCEPIAARQDKLLVFTQFREMTGPLAAYLGELFERPGLMLHGGTPVRQRQSLVTRFQQDEQLPFMVLSLKAGGSGLNLTAASHVIHFDRWWNPAVEAQASDRAFRIGQRKNVLVHRFVCRGTVEERIDALIAGKQALAEEILADGGEPRLTELSNQELLEMVSLDLDRATAA
jgi:non-specific serine/threonine protein kinase